MRSIESNQVETQCRLARCSNHMDSQDDPFASSGKAILCHTNSTPYWENVLVQDILTSAHKAGSTIFLRILQHSAILGDER